MRLWIDGELHPQEEARTSLLAHGLHYGTGVFEGIRAYETSQGPAIFRLEAHLERLGRGAEALGMAVDLAALGEGCLEVLGDSSLRNAYLRPLAFFHSGGLGLDVGNLTVCQMVAAMPWSNHLGEAATRGVRMRVSPWRRNPASSLPPLKICGNYVNSILAKLEATRAGFEEALFVDQRGLVVECTGENVFLVKGGRVTACEHPDALPGITRATLLALSGGESRPVHLDELFEADEVFLTGTSAEVTPVAALGNHAWPSGPLTRSLAAHTRTWPTGPITRDLAALYQDVVHGRSHAHNAWLTPVETVSVP